MKTSTPRDPTIGRREWLKTVTIGTMAASTAKLVAAKPGSSRELTEAQRATLRQVLFDAVQRKAIPGGSLVVLSRGRVMFREAIGHPDLESKEPFPIEAPCGIASVSKCITATFCVMLDEQNLVRLDDPVEKYLPQFKGVQVQNKGVAKETLRVWHLLSHRSGLPGNADMGDARPHRLAREAGAQAAEQGLDTSLEQVIARWISEGLLAEPGARFAYGSSGYMVAARIAEVVLGKRFERLLEERLLQPLGMKRTTFHPTEAIIRSLPPRYASTAKGLQRDNRVLPLPMVDGLINPAGGLVSWLDEMSAFLALHANRGLAGGTRLVRAESLARMYRPHPPKAKEAADGGGIGYGLGFNVMAPGGAARHLGASGTMVWVDLRNEHAGMLMTQVKWGPGNRPIIPALMRAVQSVFAG